MVVVAPASQVPRHAPAIARSAAQLGLDPCVVPGNALAVHQGGGVGQHGADGDGLPGFHAPIGPDIRVVVHGPLLPQQRGGEAHRHLGEGGGPQLVGVGHGDAPLHRPAVMVGVGQRPSLDDGHLDPHRPVAAGSGGNALAQRLVLLPGEAVRPAFRQGQLSRQGVTVFLQPGQNLRQLQPGHRQVRIEPMVRHAPIEPPVHHPIQGLLRVSGNRLLPGNRGPALHVLPPPGGKAVKHRRQLAPGHRREGGKAPLGNAAADPHALRPGHGILRRLRHVGVRAGIYGDQDAAKTVEGLNGLCPACRLLAVKAPGFARRQQPPVQRPAGGVPALRRNLPRVHGPQLRQTSRGLRNLHDGKALPGFTRALHRFHHNRLRWNLRQTGLLPFRRPPSGVCQRGRRSHPQKRQR